MSDSISGYPIAAEFLLIGVDLPCFGNCSPELVLCLIRQQLSAEEVLSMASQPGFPRLKYKMLLRCLISTGYDAQNPASGLVTSDGALLEAAHQAAQPPRLVHSRSLFGADVSRPAAGPSHVTPAAGLASGPALSQKACIQALTAGRGSCTQPGPCTAGSKPLAKVGGPPPHRE